MSTDDATRLGDTISERPQAMPAAWTTTLGVIAAPGLTAELAAQVGDDLADELGRRFPEQTWRVVVVEDALVTPHAATAELVDAARRRLLAERWNLAVCLTDLPLSVTGRRIAAHASVSHGVALLSVPALGAVALRRRIRESALGLVETLLGVAAGGERLGSAPASARRRLADLVELGDAPEGLAGLVALARGGRLRLLAGMLRANRPWRLAARLYRALVAALAVVAAALVTADVWRIAASLGAVRLAVLASCSIAATTISLIVVHGLWETSRHDYARDQVRLFNLVTTLTVLVGVAALYAALFLVTLAGALLLVTPDLLGQALGRPAGWHQEVALVWLATSLATLGGALGVGLEASAAVREAAYAYRADAGSD